MHLHVLGSSSAGNGYLLRASNGHTLMIECGMPLRDVKRAIDYQINQVVGCIVTHEHRDHSKYLAEVLRCGITTLAPREVFLSHNLNGRPFCHIVRPNCGYKVGAFKVYALPVAHDVPCVAYIIDHEEMGRLLFLTDTMMLEYKLPDIQHLLIEANYADDILEENILAGVVAPSQRQRLLHSHMELETTKGILRANQLINCNEVVLVHLSPQNSNRERFKAEIEALCGLPTYVATTGLTLTLTKTPF